MRSFGLYLRHVNTAVQAVNSLGINFHKLFRSITESKALTIQNDDRKLQISPTSLDAHLMSATPLHDIWEASASHPFEPTIGKGVQFNVGFTLLLFAFICSSLFGLSMSTYQMEHSYTNSYHGPDNTLKNLPIYGIPASLAFG